jgi:DNA-binding Lrp family transcriptional regulator
MRTETVRITDTVRPVRQMAKQLDRTNIKILSAMWKYGPRNLLEVSRRTGIPFTSVYHRVAKLEATSGRIAYLIPNLSKLGITRLVVLVAAKSGYEECAETALKIPNWWKSINRCEGAFTHISVQAVPAKFLGEFKNYMRCAVKSGLITRFEIIPTGDQQPNFPAFKYYNPAANRWTIPWERWLNTLKKIKPQRSILDPENYPVLADKKDLLIVKELEKNGRRRYSDLTSMLEMTLPGVKYRYDRRLVPNGIVGNFALEVHPYPPEVSAYHEVMLEFTSSSSLNKFVSLIGDLFFIIGFSKVLRKNTLMIRTTILQSQLLNMFDFFSEMAKARILNSFSSVRLDFSARRTQTISYELFDDEKGWTFDLSRCLTELRRLRAPKKLLVKSNERTTIERSHW